MLYNNRHQHPRHLARLLHNQTNRPMGECRYIVECLEDYEARILSKSMEWDTTEALALFENLYNEKDFKL